MFVDFAAVMFWIYWFPLLALISLLAAGVGMGLVKWRKGGQP